MSKPIPFFIVVYRRSFFTRWFGWLLPGKAVMKCITRTSWKPFQAKVGSVYTLDT